MEWWKRSRRQVMRFFGGLWERDGARHWIVASIVYVTLLGILLANLIPSRSELRVGQVATRDISAPKTIVNRYRTQQLRQQEAELAVDEALQDPANYVIDDKVATAAGEKLGLVFDRARELRSQLPPAQPEGLTSGTNGSESAPSSSLAPTSGQISALQQTLEADAGLRVDKQTLTLVLSCSWQDFMQLERVTLQLTQDLLGGRRIGTGDRERVVAELPDLVDSYLEREGLLPAGPGTRETVAEAVVALVESVVQPNLIPDEAKLRTIAEQAADTVEPVMVLQGEIVVRRGDVITREHAEVLKDLGLQRQRTNYLTVAGIAGVLLLSLVFLAVYLWQHQREVTANDGLLALLGLVLIISVFLAKILSLIPWEGIGYLIPSAFAAMLITLLLDSHLAIVVVVALSVIVGMVTDFQISTVVTVMAGGITGVFSVGRISQRSDLTRAGFIVGVVNFATIVFMALATNNLFILRHSYLGIVNGIVSAVLTIGFLPYLESLFGITSSIKLLELSNPNQPLLRRLLLEAPGTYHHSILVGNLAETAADAVGADGLLARVGATYHDIGKLKRPYLFVENQFTTENPHDKLSPSLSTLIITSHVKDGLELARQHKLPPALMDFIAQHHGDDLVKFFYHKAVEAGMAVDESDFRYGGPKPQTKETAIVMLADSVEAAVRSLAKPTPGRIEGMVRKLIKSRLNSGQLDECSLTLKDLDKIAHAFVQVLGGIYHSRVEYPESALKEELSRDNAEGRG